MGRRREQRLVISLPVKVSGRDLNNNPFTQDCETVDISRTGCHLRWIACLRSRGDSVEVRHGKEKARYKVSWIGKEGSKREGHVGLCLMDKKYIWGVALPSRRPDDYILSEETAPGAPPEPAAPLKVSFEPAWSGVERRQHPRYRGAGEVEATDLATNTAVCGMLSDISRGGCYVDVMSPLAAGTPIRIRINTTDAIVETRGVVRSSHPSMGMGLEFTEMSPENRQRLDTLMGQITGQLAKAASATADPAEVSRYELSQNSLATEPAGAPPARAAAPPVPTQSFDNQLVLDTLLQLLDSKGVLTREEFLQALKEATRTTRRD
ncbi:MAG: PilZ domain-containing protein [Terriglobia bacterium]